MTIGISITDSFDGGNIKFISQSEVIPSPTARTAECTITLQIKPDVYTESEQTSHMQFFAFRSFISGLESSDADSIIIKYEIENAKDVSFSYAWPGTTICYTTKSMEACDDDAWKRNLTTDYVDGKLIWSHTHDTNGHVLFAYYPLYTYNRHMKLIADCSRKTHRDSILAKYNPAVESLGQTTEGREMECVSIGSGKLIAWIIHRQHPGETMAEFYAEGLLHRLFGLGAADERLDEVTERMLSQYRLYIVPCMCPDGSVRGHIRTNGVGANLNREWATVDSNYEAPTLARSPEAYHVLNKMDETGCDFFLDVHGDESIPYVFFNGPVLTPVWGDRMMNLHGYFVSSYQRANSDVQKEYGYPPPESEAATVKTLNKASKQVSNRFDCLGFTLEMPYKDCATNPDPEYGFSPRRAKQLGMNLVEALNDVSPYLRAEGSFWSVFGDDDRFVAPKEPG
jgi:murein tripeptide amidase MpaA